MEDDNIIAHHYNIDVSQVDEKIASMNRTKQDVIAEVRAYNKRGCEAMLNSLLIALSTATEDELKHYNNRYAQRY